MTDEHEPPHPFRTAAENTAAWISETSGEQITIGNKLEAFRSGSVGFGGKSVSVVGDF